MSLIMFDPVGPVSAALLFFGLLTAGNLLERILFVPYEQLWAEIWAMVEEGPAETSLLLSVH